MKYKYYRNLLSTILKKSKQSYYEKFFQNNLNDIKNKWKGIRDLISLKQSPKSNIHLLFHNSETITDPKNIANIFNYYFSTIAEKTKAKIKFSNKSFTDVLHHPIDDSFFIKATNSDEIKNIISKLNENKSTGPNSLPAKILKLLKSDISSQLTDIFNIAFSSGIFSSNLKIAKIITIHKKESKLICSNYRPISVLSNLDKILEKLMYSRVCDYFLDKNRLIYSLQFDFCQHYSTSYALLHMIELIMKALDDGNFA